METQGRHFEETCTTLHGEFFLKFPNLAFYELVSQAFAMLLERQQNFPGEAGAWAGGTVYAVGAGRYGVPDVLNAELENTFNVKMPVIRKRAAQIKQLLGDDAPLYIPGLAPFAEFVRQEFSVTSGLAGTGR